MTDFLIWDTKRWKNGISRRLYSVNEQDPYDSRLKIGSGTERKLFIDGMGTAYLSGYEALMTINTAHHNVKFYATINMPTEITNYIEFKVRSRHNEPDPESNRFGGYSALFWNTGIWFVREDYHDIYNNYCQNIYFSDTLLNGKDYPVMFSVTDNGANVDLNFQIDWGSGLTSEASWSDESAPSVCFDKTLTLNKSYCGIRTLNAGSLDLKIKNVEVYNVL